MIARRDLVERVPLGCYFGIMIDEANDRRNKDFKWWYLLPFVLVVALWAATPYVISYLHESMSDRGQAGDLFGSINALFAGLAFAGVIIAILLQKDELSLQRQELAETRKELRRSADAQKAAHKALQDTMYAQTFKVALDLLDSDDAVTARKHIGANEKGVIEARTPNLWDADLKRNAERLMRAYDAVGALVRLELLPSEFLTDTRGTEIVRFWDILKPFVEHRRTKDELLGMDFERLARLAEEQVKLDNDEGA